MGGTVSKIYFITYFSEKLDRAELIKKLEANEISEYWQYCFTDSVFIKSSMSSRQISDFIEKEFGNIRHLVTEINPTNYHGRLPKGFWDIFH
jgi:hypothetical protein